MNYAYTDKYQLVTCFSSIFIFLNLVEISCFSLKAFFYILMDGILFPFCSEWDGALTS